MGTRLVFVGTVVGERGRKITLGPIVKAKPNQKQIEFIAKDATTFVRRVLLEEELAALNKGGGIPQVRDSILRFEFVVVIEHGTRGIRSRTASEIGDE